MKNCLGELLLLQKENAHKSLYKYSFTSTLVRTRVRLPLAPQWGVSLIGKT